MAVKPCTACGKTVGYSSANRPRRHKSPAGEWCQPQPVSEPAPTVEETTVQGDDVAESRCDDADCVCGGDDVDEVQEQIDYERRVTYGPDKGPWFGAMYDGRCSVSECQIYEGDRIRADGYGGYECEDCGDDASWSPAQRAERDWQAQRGPLAGPAYVDELRIPAMPLPTAEEFLDPDTATEPKPVMSVSGQPKEVLRDHLGRYAVVLPGESELELYKSSGKPVGRTRATTFNKSATDKKNINDWGKRNVLIGASRRRDLVLQATGLTHEDDKDRLNALVVQLEETAGSKVGSDLGTYLHDFTEYMDAGLKTFTDAPLEFQGSLYHYQNALADAGLEPIRSLIERTTIIREYGWVCGTFDRIFFHRPSGQYVIGDLKTGKTMDYGKNEIECQLWTYAHGVNQNGVYDWNTQTWEPAGNLGGPDYDRFIEVSEKVGVVIHMPVQGPKEGTVELLWADLESGAAHAEVCAAVRARPNGRMKAWGDGPAPLVPPAGPDWEALFADVTDQLEATKRWREAKAAGITGVRLNELIAIARRSLESGS